MLQKDVSYELSLSPVKTHRILYNLEQRGIVSSEKHFNTKKITLDPTLLE